MCFQSMTKPAFMQYRLLRNNKESGPFTKAQLEEMGLKPYDLLWIEGRGGAWQYASEIEDLKSIAPVVEEQPYDRFYKGKEKQTTDNKPITTITAPTSTVAPAPKSAKPRFRISGDKIVMIDNTALEQPQPIMAVVAAVQKAEPVAAQPHAEKREPAKPAAVAGPDWEEMYSEWKGEEKEPEPVAAAKTQTFEEIKQRFEESKHKQANEKQNTTASATKQNIMAAVAIIVLAIGGYAGYRLNQNSDQPTSTTATPVTEKAEIIQDETGKQQNVSTEPLADATTQPPVNTPVKTPAGKDNEINNTISNTNQHAATAPAPPAEKIKKDTPAAGSNIKQPVVIPKNTAPLTTTVAPAVKKNTTPELNPVQKKTDVPASVKDKKTDGNWTDVKKANTAAPLQIPTASETTTVKQVAPKKRISDYVSINKLGNLAGTNGVQNVQLSVKNITDFPIDLAVVDIQYYAANGRYLRGETMYVKNIGSGDNVNVRVPDNRTARSINYKVSLVSAEQKTLYLVGD